MAPRRTPADLVHPPVEAIDLLRVLHALSDETRMRIVQTLAQDPERACGTVPVDVAASTMTHHFKVLSEAGLILQRPEVVLKWTSLRSEDLDARFPGLLPAILSNAPAL